MRVKVGVGVVIAVVAVAIVALAVHHFLLRKKTTGAGATLVAGSVVSGSAAASELARRLDERDERERCRRDCRSAVQPMSCIDRCFTGRRPGRA